MSETSTLKQFWQTLFGNRWWFGIFIAAIVFLATIPPRTFFKLPILEPKEPILKEIQVEIPAPDPYPVNTTQKSPPQFSAQSIMAVEVTSKAVIFMKNPNTRLYPASTTKMVTGLVAIEAYDLDQVVTIQEPILEGQVMFLYQDEQITIRNMLYGVLVHSANDAAEELASLHPQGKGAFIEAMNQRVRQLGLEDTHFVNPTGLDHYDHYSSVHDLAIIGAEVMSNPTLSQMVSTQAITVYDTSGEIVHPLENVNQLLGLVEGMKGIKTGWTENAGECLVAYTERDGHAVITAILGSQDRFGDTVQLIEWIFTNHEWEEIQLPEGV